MAMGTNFSTAVKYKRINAEKTIYKITFNIGNRLTYCHVDVLQNGISSSKSSLTGAAADLAGAGSSPKP